jgi:hypothetical protein
VTQTPEDRRAADSAVEVLGAAATPAGFTVRTLKLLVTATVTDRLGTGGSPSPGPGPGVTGRLQGQWPGTRRPPRRHREGACEELDLPGQLSDSRYNVLGELGTLDTRGARVANVTSVPKFCRGWARHGIIGQAGPLALERDSDIPKFKFRT